MSYLDDDNESFSREVVEQSDPRVFDDKGVCRINLLPPTVPKECLYCDGNGVEYKRVCGHSRVQRCVDVYFGNCGNCADVIEVQCPEPSCGAIRKRTCHEYEQQIREGHPPTCTNVLDKVCRRSTFRTVEGLHPFPCIFLHLPVTHSPYLFIQTVPPLLTHSGPLVRPLPFYSLFHPEP